jgi:rubrerythrin
MSYPGMGSQQQPHQQQQGSMQMYQQQALQRSLALMKEAVEGEMEDRLFYDYLIKQAPTKEQKQIIASIRDDEIGHNRMFRQIYKDITGQDIQVPTDVQFEKPKSYKDGLVKALFGELKAVEKYRVIRQGLPNEYYRDILFNIITDEIKHSAKYNYLITINQSTRITETETQTMSGPDQLVTYIEPLVQEALKEVKEGINLTHLFQEYILAGVLVGDGYTPEEAIKTVEKWEKTGESQLLVKSKKLGQQR